MPLGMRDDRGEIRLLGRLGKKRSERGMRGMNSFKRIFTLSLSLFFSPFLLLGEKSNYRSDVKEMWNTH